jgi:NitT/TauT family transport system substrate-binding protein
MPIGRRSSLAVLASVATLAVAPGLLRRPAGAQEAGVTVATLINDTATAALYASKAGLFKKYGINAELQIMNSGAAAAAAIAGGAAQFGISSLVTLIEAHERGVGFTLVAPAGTVTSDVPYSQFVVRKDVVFKSGRDFNGRTVGVPALKDLDSVAIMNWVDQTGGDSKTLRFVEIPASAAVAAIEEGRIDGANLNTPTLTRALEGGKLRTLAQIFDAIAPRFTNTGWFTTAEYVTKNRGLVERFARAIRESALYCNAHHAETVPLVAQNAKLDEALVARMPRITFGEYLNAREIQPLIDVAFKYKAIEKRFDAQELISPAALRRPS